MNTYAITIDGITYKAVVLENAIELWTYGDKPELVQEFNNTPEVRRILGIN